MFANTNAATTVNNEHQVNLIDMLRIPRIPTSNQVDESDDFFNTKKEIPGSIKKEEVEASSHVNGSTKGSTRHTTVSSKVVAVDMTEGNTEIIGKNNSNNDNINVGTGNSGDLTITGGNQNTISPDKFAQLANKFESGGARNNGGRHNNHRTQ
jgi:hypothetical protein